VSALIGEKESEHFPPVNRKAIFLITCEGNGFVKPSIIGVSSKWIGHESSRNMCWRYT
jgi:hypothetical protein